MPKPCFCGWKQAKLHKENCRQYSNFYAEYYDFDTLEDVEKSRLKFTKCKLCFKGEMQVDKMSTNDMITYLKQVVSMESNVYTQERAIKTARNNLVKKQPQKDFIDKPEQEKIEKPTPTTYNGLTGFGKWIVYDFIVSGVIILFVSLILLFSGNIGLGLVSILGGGICIFIGKALTRNAEKNKKFYEDKYLEELKIYETNLDKSKKNYKIQMDEYNKKKNEAEQNYKQELTIIEQNYDLAKKSILQMEEPYENAKQLLQQLYDLDIIFPKYRNMIAMCSIYEYFVSGRCTELTGADGAYNLYESELRQDLIINKLDTIIKQLEAIKQNQYVLYSEIKNTNSILTDIGKDVKNILENTNKITQNTYITAVCSQATAKNTEALKYISLING